MSFINQALHESQKNRRAMTAKMNLKGTWQFWYLSEGGLSELSFRAIELKLSGSGIF